MNWKFWVFHLFKYGSEGLNFCLCYRRESQVWGCCILHVTEYGLLYVEIKCQQDATDEFFIADLVACSTCFGHHYAHHQELDSIIQVVAAC
jgi:hypothetical protein